MSYYSQKFHELFEIKTSFSGIFNPIIIFESPKVNLC
jgi:hypothetical protein